MRKHAIIDISNVSKVYTSNSENIISLDKLNLTIYKGEKIGLIGNNGAGKTTLLRVISGISKASSGRISVQGKVASLIELSSGFHPDLTGMENVHLSGLLLGMTRNEINQLLDTIIKFSELSHEVLSRPTHTYSSGMLLRLGFSIAVHSNPDILVIDENIVVGDQDFQKKAYDAIEDMFHSGKTIILSTHLLSFIQRLCGRVIWLKDGKIHKVGESSTLIKQYKRDVFDKLNSPMRGVAAEAFQLLKSLPVGEEFFAEANSSSMEPTILKGETVKIRRTSLGSIKKGDIIAYWNDEIESTMVHRFYRVDGEIITVKGDNNLVADAISVSRRNLLGVVVDIAS